MRGGSGLGALLVEFWVGTMAGDGGARVLEPGCAGDTGAFEGELDDRR